MVTPRTMPLCGAAMTCSIFIASTTATCWPLAHGVADRDIDRRRWCPGSARRRPSEPSGPGQFRRGVDSDRGGCFRLHLRVMGEQRQRIAALDPGTGEAARRSPPDGVVRRSAAVDRAAAASAAMCSSTQRVWTLPAAKSGCARMLCRNGMLVPTPSMPELAERARGASDRAGEIRRRRVGDHLGEQRVERAAGAIAGIAKAVGPHARPARRLIDGQRAAAGPHRAVGADRFHVDASLDRVSRAACDPSRSSPSSRQASRPAPAGFGSAPDRRRSPPRSPCARPASRAFASMNTNGGAPAGRIHRPETRKCQGCGSRRCCAKRTAASMICSRRSSSSAGAGAISMIF